MSRCIAGLRWQYEWRTVATNVAPVNVGTCVGVVNIGTQYVKDPGDVNIVGMAQSDECGCCGEVITWQQECREFGINGSCSVRRDRRASTVNKLHMRK